MIALVERLWQRIAFLEERAEGLGNQCCKNSCNSSKPQLIDEFKPRTKSLRSKSEHHSGGQTRHVQQFRRQQLGALGGEGTASRTVTGYQLLKNRSEVHDRDYDKEMGGKVEEWRSRGLLIIPSTPYSSSTSAINACSAVVGNKFWRIYR